MGQGRTRSAALLERYRTDSSTTYLRLTPSPNTRIRSHRSAHSHPPSSSSFAKTLFVFSQTQTYPTMGIVSSTRPSSRVFAVLARYFGRRFRRHSTYVHCAASAVQSPYGAPADPRPGPDPMSVVSLAHHPPPTSMRSPQSSRFVATPMRDCRTTDQPRRGERMFRHLRCGSSETPVPNFTNVPPEFHPT